MKFRKKNKYFLKKYKRNRYVRNEYFWKKKSLNNKIYTKSKIFAKFYKIITIFFMTILYSFNIFINETYDQNNNYGLTLEQKMKDYLTKNFSIMKRFECVDCGFFSFYIVYLGCINKLLSIGKIPIVDLKTYTNAFNKGNTSIYNPWELFFYQPYNYTIEEVLAYAKNYEYYQCSKNNYRPDEINIYDHKDQMIFWHDFANKYIPVRNEIIKEAEDIMKQLFGNSKNVLGVKIRGTDYISLRPYGHSIPPKVEEVILDVKKMDEQYNYDFIFFASEDELIKQKFSSEFKNKIKLLNPNVVVKYSYTDNHRISVNKNIYGNLEYLKNYILNTIILSKCLDFVTSRCCGATGVYILTKGFRYSKAYNLGEYKL